MLDIYRKSVSISIILVNVYFLWATSIILWNKGGPMGFGAMVLPFTLSINFLLVPAFLNLKANRKNNYLTIINSIGLIWSVFWLIFSFNSN